MRTIREPPNSKQLINHPLHPSGRAVPVDRTNAIEYVTAMLARRIAKLSEFFGAGDPRAITLVPVPSSEVTASTIETARFRTLRLCRALAGVGLGTVAVLAVQRAPMVAKTKGVRRTADQILAGFVRTSAAVPRSTMIVLVDDNVQSGNSIAALDRLLGASRPTAAFAVAVTDAHECKDALKARGFTIEYDDEAEGLEVRCTLGHVR
jgi:predicted amidophosphoribosyltransferase